MGRWKAANITAFGSMNSPMHNDADADMIGHFSVGGPRLVVTGQKIWPVKGKDVRKLWCTKPVNMTRDVIATQFMSLPVNIKFSRFAELNKQHKGFYLMAMFPKPIHDKNDVDGVMTFGYVVNYDKTIPHNVPTP